MDRNVKSDVLIKNRNWLYPALIIANVVLFIVLIFVSVFRFAPELPGAVYYNYVAEIINPEYHEIYNGVYISCTINSAREKQIVEYLEKFMDELPLYEYDYIIVLTDDELNSDVAYAQGHTIAGVTDNSKKVIKIQYAFLEHVFLHEIGHAVDATHGFSETEEFQALYNQVEHDSYETCVIQEYFAHNYNLFLKGQLIDTELLEYFSQKTYGKSFWEA